MADIDTSAFDSCSSDELTRLTELFRDDECRSILSDLLKDISDGEVKKRFEEELKKFEKQRGVQAIFIEPQSNGFVVAVFSKENKVLVNICSSDKVGKPSSSPAVVGEKNGLNWTIPHVITSPRNVLCNSLESIVVQDMCHKWQIYTVDVVDVIFHGYALHLAEDDERLRQTIIETAVDALRTKLGNDDLSSEVIQGVHYVGKPQWSVIRKVVDEKLYLKSLDGGDDDLGSGMFLPISLPPISEDVRTFQSTAAPKVPKYVLKYSNNADLQDYMLNPTNPVTSLRPKALIVDVKLPGITKSSQVDANVFDKKLSVITICNPKYSLELTLPFVVDDDASSAKFDVSTETLTMTMPLLLNLEKGAVSGSPPDSGIECENGERNNDCDGDNSSEETSTDSLIEIIQESTAVQTTFTGMSDQKLEVMAEDPAGNEGKLNSQLLLPLTYHAMQSDSSLIISVSCSNIVPGSFCLNLQDGYTAILQWTSVGGGAVPLTYGLTVKSSLPFSDVKPLVQFKEDELTVTLVKGSEGKWNFCQLGSKGKMKTVLLQYDEISPDGLKEFSDHLSEAAFPSYQPMGRKGDARIRTLSECSSPNKPMIGCRGSWPRGILKIRCRSLSESHAELSVPIGSFTGSDGGFSSMGELEAVADEEDEEEGEKKSVRFNDVVCRQLFRSNSSILGQRTKNQRKAQKKRRAIERRASENDSANSDVFEEVGASGGEEGGSASEESGESQGVTEQMSNTASVKKAVDKGKKVAKHRKPRKNLKVELTNGMIFQLDVEP